MVGTLTLNLASVNERRSLGEAGHYDDPDIGNGTWC